MMVSPPTNQSTTTTLLVFDSELAVSLASSTSPSSPSTSNARAYEGVITAGGRFGTVYVGCRRVRPSSRLVQRAVKQQKKNKKKSKQQIDQEEEGGGDEALASSTTTAAAPRADAAAAAAGGGADPNSKTRKRRRQQHHAAGAEKGRVTLSLSAVDGDIHDDPATRDTKLIPGDDAGTQHDVEDEPDDDDDEYYRFPSAGRVLNSSLVKEEVADLCGEREGVPPVALPYSMMRLLGGAFATTTAAGDDHGVVPSRFRAVLDPELSKQWATRLKDSMLLAETLRDQDESIRKMPYVLEPEAWNRKRPETLLVAVSTTSTGPGPDATTSDAAAEVVAPATTAAEPNPLESLPPRSWFGCQYDTTDPSQETNELVRQQQLQQQRSEMCDAAVVQLLHTHTHLHVSCGAKFGCDYLLYQGSRNDHHAFAGLRVLVPAGPNEDDNRRNVTNDDEDAPDSVLERLPLPTPYDMAGYVRGLNTAGKLALLATAVPAADDDDDHQYKSHDGHNDRIPTYRVAVVDLALKKVRATTFRGASGTVMPKMLPKRPAAG
jgi:hypothetical protein